MVLRLCFALLIPWWTLIWIFVYGCKVAILMWRSNFSPNYWLMHIISLFFFTLCDNYFSMYSQNPYDLSLSFHSLSLFIQVSFSKDTAIGRDTVCSRNKKICRISSLRYTTQVWLKKSEEIKNAWRQWKRENTIQKKSVVYSKSCCKREVYSDTSLPQDTRKTSNKQPILTPKRTRKKNK